MDDPTPKELMETLSRAIQTLTDLISAVVLACNDRNAIDAEKLRGMLEGLASRPDVALLDRSILERMLREIP